MCSVCIAKDGEVVACKELNDGFSHSENLNVFIEEVTSEAGLVLADMDAIAVGKGPGSYTGLRIGVSTAKGICFALDLPLISVSTLEAMASQVVLKGRHAELFCPMLDARRMEVYAAIFDSDLDEVKPISADIIDMDSYQEYLAKGKVNFFGPGSAKCKDALSSNVNASFIDGIYPSSRSIAGLAEAKFQQKEFEDVAYFEPFYLKDFVATVSKKS